MLDPVLQTRNLQIPHRFWDTCLRRRAPWVAASSRVPRSLQRREARTLTREYLADSSNSTISLHKATHSGAVQTAEQP